jgi:hypothetical protein
MTSRFVVHRHSTGRPHFDLRVVIGDFLRCWSLLREPPGREGERRLAVERESFEAAAIGSRRFREAAFGEGRVTVWDEGEVEITPAAAGAMDLDFRGSKLTGAYGLRPTRWYPGNRWLLEKRRVPRRSEPGQTGKLA